MKHHTVRARVNRKTTDIARPVSSAGKDAVSIDPPNYGIDFLDSETMKMRVPVHQHRSAAASHRIGQQRSGFIDNRPEAAAQRELNELTWQSPRAVAQRALQERIDNGPYTVARRKQIQGLFGSAVQKAATSPNHTGLPDHLKAGIEKHSGLCMDDVKVHYNSSEPARLDALAYTQGADIYVAFGQERHLPHEAWHVVQQARGCVKPTMQMNNGVPVNDDPKLEREAEVMGTKALAEQELLQGESSPAQFEFEPGFTVVQRAGTKPNTPSEDGKYRIKLSSARESYVYKNRDALGLANVLPNYYPWASYSLENVKVNIRGEPDENGLFKKLMVTHVSLAKIGTVKLKKPIPEPDANKELLVIDSLGYEGPGLVKEKEKVPLEEGPAESSEQVYYTGSSGRVEEEEPNLFAKLEDFDWLWRKEAERTRGPSSSSSSSSLSGIEPGFSTTAVDVPSRLLAYSNQPSSSSSSSSLTRIEPGSAVVKEKGSAVAKEKEKVLLEGGGAESGEAKPKGKLFMDVKIGQYTKSQEQIKMEGGTEPGYKPVEHGVKDKWRKSRALGYDIDKDNNKEFDNRCSKDENVYDVWKAMATIMPKLRIIQETMSKGSITFVGSSLLIAFNLDRPENSDVKLIDPDHPIVLDHSKKKLQEISTPPGVTTSRNFVPSPSYPSYEDYVKKYKPSFDFGMENFIVGWFQSRMHELYAKWLNNARAASSSTPAPAPSSTAGFIPEISALIDLFKTL